MTITPTPTPQLRRLPASAGADKIIQVMEEDGGVIVEGFYTSDAINSLNQELDPHMARYEIPESDKTGFFADFLGPKTKKLGQLVSISKTFRHEYLNHELMHEICRKVFCPTVGDYWLTATGVTDRGPGTPPQPLHRDQAVFPVFREMGSAAPVAMINFFGALSEFTDANGATRVIPGSHKWPDFTDAGTPEQTVPALMQPGDVMVFTGKTAHGGGQNVTSNSVRRALSIAIQASYLTPQESHMDLPRSLVETMTPLAQKMIAWRSTFPPYTGGLWTLRLRDLGSELGLKSCQPEKK